MRFFKIIAVALVFCLLFAACATAQTGVNRKHLSKGQSSTDLESNDNTSVDNQISSQQTVISSKVSNQTTTQSKISIMSQSQISGDTGVTSQTSSVYSEISSVLAGVSSEEESIVSRDLPVVSVIEPDYGDDTNSITSDQPSAKLPEDINAVPDYLKDHPVMEGTRDKYYWPFSKDSIWNMPVGSGAQLEPAGFEKENNVSFDPEYFVQTTESDPIIDVYAPSSWETRMPGKQYLGKLRVPNSFMLADGSGQNNCATFVMPDGYSYYQLEPTCRTEEYLDRIIGWIHNKAPMSLYDQGIGGSHYGSGLSAIGGSIRKGELTSNGNINHAIKINVWAKKYLYYSNQVPGYTWPADRCDSYADVEGHKNKYGGTNPLIVQGSLLVLPRNLQPKSLGIKTEVGKKIFYAMQNYGAYISDDSAWSCYALCVEDGVNEEVQAKYGYSLRQSEGELYTDINRIMMFCQIVTNNTANSIGGGGTPCQPLAPDFAD